ncbi:sensor histidine kinase [Paenibacillus sp.]|uniref:cache domain-containing sensor histidine kinase n=1 Tax=Paenibacillus sp. TaxID=58172 RepID=UPI002D2389E6|nr:sensor histidine kinase [Paenibacillus sp.]HZG58135.1 sensor histidine kinase [Paenibacillus sp.]
MLSWISRFHNFKLQNKILLSFAAVIVLTVLPVAIVIYQVSVKTINKNIAEYSHYLNEQVGINLDNRTREIEEQVFQLFASSGMNISGEAGSQQFEIEQLLQSRYASSYMAELLLSESYYESVLLIGASGRRHLLERRNGLNSEERLPETFSLEAVQEARGRAIWLPGTDDGLVFMAKSLYSIRSSVYAGTVVVGIDSDYLRSLYTSFNELTDGSMLILNESNEPIITESPVPGLHAHFLKNRMYEASRSGSTLFRFKGEDYIYSVLRMPNDKWKIVHIVSVDQQTRGTVVIQFWTVTVLIAGLLLAFLSSVIISKRMTENIRLLMHSMSRLSVDFSHQAIVPKSRDEIGILAERFNSMTEKINELVNTLYKEQLLKQDAEFRTLQSEYKTLQAQINPHFLYNTLESIQSLAKLKGEEEIGDMIYLLGALLRDSIGKRSDVVTLKDEVGYISKYLDIQRFMYEDRIEIIYDLDEDLMDCLVPKFILQPLVENAIVHGIEQKPGKGVVRLASRTDGTDLIVEVSDNGIGMSREEIDRVMNRIDAVPEKRNHTSVGLMNVHKRVRILYGERYGINISGNPGEGTTILIRLPSVKEGENYEEIRSGD